MLRHVRVGDNERLFLIRKGRFEGVLVPGQYWIVGFGLEFERHDVRQVLVYSQWTDFLIKQRWELVSRYFTVVETTDSQVAVVYFEDKVSRVIGPGCRVLFWRGSVEVTYDVIDAQSNAQVPALLVPSLARLGRREAHAMFALVDEGKRGLLYVDGRFIRELLPGSYAFWDVAGRARVDIVDLRMQAIEIGGHEMLTRDKVTLRANVLAKYQITEPALARSAVEDVCEHLYRTLQSAVRQTMRKRTLQEVLADKVAVDETVAREVRAEMKGYGVRVAKITITFIGRRGETAGTRLRNPAKLMADNPILVA